MLATVFDKEQTHAFIECKCLDELANIMIIEHELNAATSWESKVHIISYFVAIVIEKKKKDGKDVKKIIDALSCLSEEMFLDISPLDNNFINFMLRNANPETQTLEKALIELHQRWVEYDYSRTIRM